MSPMAATAHAHPTLAGGTAREPRQQVLRLHVAAGSPETLATRRHEVLGTPLLASGASADVSRTNSVTATRSGKCRMSVETARSGFTVQPGIAQMLTGDPRGHSVRIGGHVSRHSPFTGCPSALARRPVETLSLLALGLVWRGLRMCAVRGVSAATPRCASGTGPSVGTFRDRATCLVRWGS